MEKLKKLLLIATLAMFAFGLGGCQKKDTTIKNKQTLPLVGNPVSPLPTPNAATSPLQR